MVIEDLNSVTPNGFVSERSQPKHLGDGNQFREWPHLHERDLAFFSDDHAVSPLGQLLVTLANVEDFLEHFEIIKIEEGQENEEIS